MITSKRLSIAIATYNEEQFIGQCLDSVATIADEIILVDGHSSDKTTTIAKQHKNVKVFETTNKSMFHLNKQMAIDHCSGTWILQLDADEIVSNSLQKEIDQLINRDPKDIPENGFWVNRANFFLTKFLKKGGQYPDRTLRLYKNGKGRLPCNSVHEQAVVEGKVGYLTSDLLHYADASFSRYLFRNDRYTTLIAEDLANNHLNANTLNFINYFFIKPPAWFIKTYFRHKGFQDGFPGFVFSWYSSLRFPLAFIKYYELIHKSKTI